MPALRAALEALGEPTDGHKGALVARLKSTLRLEAQPTNLDNYKRASVTGGNTTTTVAVAAAGGDGPKKKKPKPAGPPPTDTSSAYDQWEQMIDSISNRPYYRNTTTDECVWHDPRGDSTKKKKPKPAGPPPTDTSSSLTSNGSSNGELNVQVPAFGAMLQALAHGGAHVTVNAPGAFAAGCNVYMNDTNARSGADPRALAGPSGPGWNARWPAFG